MFDERVPPAEYATFDDVARRHAALPGPSAAAQIETLRRLKYRPTGGFCFFALNDPSPMVSWSVLDHERVPKLGYLAVDRRVPAGDGDRRPAAAVRRTPARCSSLDVHVVNDTRRAIEASDHRRRASWASGVRRWKFAGDIEPDSVAKVGTVTLSVPDTLGALHFDYRLAFGASEGGPGEVITNGYTTAVTVATRVRGRMTTPRRVASRPMERRAGTGDLEGFVSVSL